MNDDDSKKNNFDAGGIKDRRTQPHLRNIFDKACKITEPFFDQKQSWGGAYLTMYARQTLREAFPNLTQQEIAILLSVVSRHHRDAENNQTH